MHTFVGKSCLVSFPWMGQRAVTTAFVDIADTLATRHDIVEMLHRLCGHCVNLLGMAAALVVLTNERRDPHVAASTSDELARVVQPHRHLGHDPVSECLRTGQPQAIADLTHRGDGWPLASQAGEHGVACAYLLPMRSSDATIGALVLLGDEFAGPPPEDVDLCQALADAATAGMLQQQALDQAERLNSQLHQALTSRVLIEQAKSMLAERAGIKVDQAFTALRDYARAHNQSLHDLASRAIDNDEVAGQVLKWSGRCRQR